MPAVPPSCLFGLQPAARTQPRRDGRAGSLSSWPLVIFIAAIAGSASGSAVVSRRPRSIKAMIEPAPFAPDGPTLVPRPVCGTYQVRCDATLRRVVPSAAGCPLGGCVDCTQQLQAAGVNCATPPSQCHAHCAGGICPMFYLPVCVQLANGEVCTYSNDCLARDCGATQWVTKPADRPCSSAPDATTVPPRTRPHCICPRNFVPVCGDDGQTYNNACLAACAGATVVSPGHCAGDNEEIECTDNRAVQAVVDNVTRTHVATWFFIAKAAGDYTISTCDSDMDTQLLVGVAPSDPSAHWIDPDSCGDRDHRGETYTQHFEAGSRNPIAVRPYPTQDDNAVGSIRLQVSSSAAVGCPLTGAGIPDRLECGQWPWSSVLEPFTNWSIPFSVTPAMRGLGHGSTGPGQNVVLSSCLSDFDTVLTVFDAASGGEVGFNDDNSWICNENYTGAAFVVASSAALCVDECPDTQGGCDCSWASVGSCNNDDDYYDCCSGCCCDAYDDYLPVGDYTVVLGGYRGQGGNFSVALECGGGLPEDPCRHCPEGEFCQVDPNNATCVNWDRDHHYAVDRPASCQKCMAPPAGHCGPDNCGGPSSEQVCTISVNQSTQGICCDGEYLKPDYCYSCHSRLNPPHACPVVTRPPVSTTLIPATMETRAQCGDLEVFDDESCGFFCADTRKQGGAIKASKWGPGQDGDNFCCCLDADSSIDPEQCCTAAALTLF